MLVGAWKRNFIRHVNMQHIVIMKSMQYIFVVKFVIIMLLFYYPSEILIFIILYSQENSEVEINYLGMQINSLFKNEFRLLISR